MAGITFHKDVLRSFLREQKIASLGELKQALGTTATMTVFRRLKELGYQTSYSHRGKYYTLAEIPEFDPWGLWRCGSAELTRLCSGRLTHYLERRRGEEHASFFSSRDLKACGLVKGIGMG